MTLHTPPLQVTCSRCNGPLFPWDANGGCATCAIRPDERLVKLPSRGRDCDGWEWRLGRDGKRRAVWLKGRKA